MANPAPDRYGARVRINAPSARSRAIRSHGGVLCAALALALACVGCGKDEGPSGGRPEHKGAQGEAIELSAAPGPAGLLELLDGSHLEARRVLGPHRITCTGTYEAGPDTPPAQVKVGQHQSITVDVRDRSELVWASDDPHEPAFALSTSVENGAPRPGDDVSQTFEARALEGSIYTHQQAQPWYVRPLQSDAHELWLDDAERCLLGPVSLAAPRLAVAGSPSEGGMVYALSRADARVEGVMPADPRSAWRGGATIESIEGQVVIGPDGLWRSGTVDVTYRADDVDGRLVRGTVHVEAKREIAPQTVQAPPQATPTPSRLRHQVERDELLDGLAG